MPYGIHKFYVFPTTPCHVDNKSDYYVGSLIGDHHEDEEFAARLKRTEAKLRKIWGFGNGLAYYWVPGIIKPYKPLTQDQKYKRAVTKEYNKHKKQVDKILQQNLLFMDDYIVEETNRLYKRIEVLKQRYEQT